MQRLIYILFCLQLSLSGFSQITGGEYYFDIDPGFGNGVPLNISGEVIDQTMSIPTENLSDGIHKLYIRVLNDVGTWSLYDKKVIYVSPNNANASFIASAEYFFDSDPGFGNGTTINVSGDNIDDDNSIATENLTDGIHKLYIRVLNEAGIWSLYNRKVIFVNSNILNSAPIAAAEYFIDEDPGLGLGTSIEISGLSIDEDLAIDIPEDLTEGDHIIYIRVLNEDGIWSLYAHSDVSTLSNEEFELNSIKFYPNPVKDILHLDTKNQQITGFKIIDLTGKIVYKTIPQAYRVNLQNLSPGMYLVNVKTKNGSLSKKIILK